jgi:hypothetical protein
MSDIDFDDRPPVDPDDDDPRYREDHFIPDDRDELADYRRAQMLIGWNVIEGEN